MLQTVGLLEDHVMLRFSTLTILLGGLALLGCGDKETDTAEEADTDTDTDADTDTDTDFDVEGISGSLAQDDADTFTVTGGIAYSLEASAEIGEKELTGDMTWQIVENDGTSDTTTCDSEIALSGTRLSGACEDCDFAFSMSAEVTEDNGLKDCEYFEQYNYVDANKGIENAALVFFSEYSLEYYGKTYTYTNDLRTSFDYSGTSGYYTFVAYDGSDSGTATFTDNGDGTGTLDWSWSFEYEYTASNFYSYCDYVAYFDYTSAQAWGGSSYTSSLGCDNSFADVWEVELTAGDLFLATVDTVAADTAFDPYFLINGPDTCTEGIADDSFDCTFTPTDYSCPSAKLDVDADGTYQIIVGSYGSCTGETADYEIQFGKAVFAD